MRVKVKSFGFTVDVSNLKLDAIAACDIFTWDLRGPKELREPIIPKLPSEVWKELAIRCHYEAPPYGGMLGLSQPPTLDLSKFPEYLAAAEKFFQEMEEREKDKRRRDYIKKARKVYPRNGGEIGMKT